MDGNGTMSCKLLVESSSLLQSGKVTCYGSLSEKNRFDIIQINALVNSSHFLKQLTKCNAKQSRDENKNEIPSVQHRENLMPLLI